MHYEADSYVDDRLLGLEIKTDQEAFDTGGVVCLLYPGPRASVNATTLRQEVIHFRSGCFAEELDLLVL